MNTISARTPRALALAMACLALGACSGLRPAPAAPMPDPAAQPGGTCNAVNAQYVLGKTVDQRLAEEAQRRAGARVVRVLRPGQVTTMEFSTSRLNLDADAQGIVTAVRCG